jgi:hypothetical protein
MARGAFLSEWFHKATKMRANLLIALALSTSLAGCYSYSRTVEERQPIVVQPQSQPSSTVIVPPGSTVVCPADRVC